MAVLTGVYVIAGGYMATAINDFIQGIIMLFGICAVIAAVLGSQGGGDAVFPAELAGVAHKDHGGEIGGAVSEGGEPGPHGASAQHEAVDVSGIFPAVQANAHHNPEKYQQQNHFDCHRKQHLDSATMPEFFGNRFGSTSLKITASVIIFIFLIRYRLFI